MTSRRTHGRIAWMGGVTLLCAAVACAQNSPGAQPNAQANPGAQPTGQMGTQPGTGMQTPDAAGAAGSGSTNGRAADKHFVEEATESSNAEIALGKLAQDKSSSPDVKQFGERMVTDHTKLNDQMAPVAQQMGVTVSPDQIPAKDKALQAKLQGLSGDQFDRAYIKAMVKDHTEDVKKFKHEASATKDPTLQQNVQQGLQVIQQHLQLAQQLAQAHNVSAGGGSQSGSGK